VSRRAAAALPYAVFLFLCAVSWNRWIEPFVDTGRELMVPWRVGNGEALYRDVRFYYGPLAPYLAAGVDSVAGRSLPARIALAAVIALLHLEALRRLARKLLPVPESALAAALAVAVAFFLRPGGCHLFPYSLDTSIAVAAVTGALLYAAGGGSRARDRAAAACLLAALVSRPEIGAAGIAALAVERLRGTDTPGRRRFLALSLASLGAAGAVYAAVSAGTPVATLSREGWLAFLFLPPEFVNVYLSFSGLDRPALRLAELVLAAIVAGLAVVWLLLASFVSARIRGRSPAAGRAVEIGALAALAAAAYLRLRPPRGLSATVDLFPPLVRVLPLLLFGAALAGLARRLADRARAPLVTGVPDSVLLVSLFFAARVFLAAGYVGPYNGFYLPLAVVVSTALLLSASGALARSVPMTPRPDGLSVLFAGALGVFLIYRIAALSLAYRSPVWSRVETPVGRLMVPEPVAGATRRALADLEARVPPGGGLAGFPETGFLNYALGRRNPLAQDQFFPGHLDAAAEEEAIARLRSDPPAAVVFANVRTVGHGREAFGKDYLERLDAFVRENFPAAAAFGPGAASGARIGDPQFFLEVRAPRATSAR